MEETDLAPYQAAYDSDSQRIRPPSYEVRDLVPKRRKKPFAPDLDPSPFFEEAHFESLINCNWDADNLQIEDPAQDDPKKQ